MLRYTIPFCPRPTVVGRLQPIDALLQKQIQHKEHEKAVNQYVGKKVIHVNEVSGCQLGICNRFLLAGVLAPSFISDPNLALACGSFALADALYGLFLYKPLTRSEELIAARKLVETEIEKT